MTDPPSKRTTVCFLLLSIALTALALFNGKPGAWHWVGLALFGSGIPIAGERLYRFYRHPNAR